MKLVALLAVLSAVAATGCSVTNAAGITFPCTSVPFTSPTGDGEAKWTGPSGSFDIAVPSASPDVEALLSVDRSGAPASEQTGTWFYVALDVTPMDDAEAEVRPDLRDVHVAMDAIPSGAATYDLASLHAKACYCGDAHPLATAYGAAAPCTNAAGELSEHVCEPLAGTLVVQRMEEKCPTAEQYSIDGMCADAYDVTLDVPEGAGRFSAHAHAAQDHELDVGGCVPNPGD